MSTDEIILTQLTNQLRSAYRKYKSFVYYDSFGSIQKLELSNFERNPKIFDDEFEIDVFFQELAKIIMDEKKFEILVDFICDNIDVISFPKHVAQSDKETKVIRNFPIENFNMDRLYYFIDLPIIGHIIGVLWILRCGYLLDDKLYKNCYGNRLNKHLLEKLKDKNGDYYIENDCRDFTPFLFINYFPKYESWRDNGLKSVENLLDDKKNAIMISLDLKEFFYRSLIDFNGLKKDISDTRKKVYEKYNYSKSSKEEKFNVKIDDCLTNFIEKVCNSYSDKFERNYATKTFNNRKIDVNKYPMLPVGFIPSRIIANWSMQGFDQAIVENVMPHYYGRYVDDILIVLGSHEKNESHGLEQIEQESLDELIERYLTDNKPPKTHIFKKDSRWEDEKIYRIHNQSFKNSQNRKITFHYEGLEIQDAKLKTYFFSHKYSKALIENFKNEIRKNSIDFKLMQDLESLKDEFKENLYKINYKESINKIRDIENVDVNKFEISKILSRVNMNTTDTIDKIDDDLINDMVDAFKGKIFEYFTLWDRLFTTLLINNKYRQLRDLIVYIQRSINEITYNPMEGNSYKLRTKGANDIDYVKTSLMKCLYYSLCRVFSLKYNSKVEKIIEDIKFDFRAGIKIDFHNHISNCLYASMQHTSLMSDPLMDLSCIYDDFDHVISFDLMAPDNNYVGDYNGFCYPKFIKLHECMLHTIKNELFSPKYTNDELKALLDEKYDDEDFIENLLAHIRKYGNYLEKAFRLYHEKNFANDKNLYKKYIKRDCGLKCKKDSHCPLNIYEESQFKDVNVINVKGERKDKIKVGLLNTNVSLNDFEKRILGKPNLYSKRFDKIKLLINEALKKNVDLLVMPEMFIPFEWIGKIVNISKDHQMAMIFCTEPVEHKYAVGNYIMMTLPFIYENKYKECAVMYRPKNHYSPQELMQFEKYEKKIKGENEDMSKYFMCIWNDIHIVPYSSYEIASLEDRGIFKSCCDIVTVSECNNDTKYINGILESLTRDLFSYCIKSNSSEYGGSCIIQPTIDNEYIINLKGSDDDYIATCELDIKKLRKNAIKSDKINDSSNFEAKPPDFWKNNVKMRY